MPDREIPSAILRDARWMVSAKQDREIPSHPSGFERTSPNHHGSKSPVNTRFDGAWRTYANCYELLDGAGDRTRTGKPVGGRF